MLDFMPVDNGELIETKFIDDEVDKAINPIVDYKKVRFFPANEEWDIIPKFKINLNFYTISSINNNSAAYANSPSFDGAASYADLGFSFDDLFCRAERVMNSFLRLNFYDGPESNTNNLVFFNDIYTQIGKDQKNEFGFLLPTTQCPISFMLGDSVLEPEEVHEGYYSYWFQDLVDNAPNQEYELYMSAVFNNATNGESIVMYSTKTVDYTNIVLSEIMGPGGTFYLKVTFRNHNGIYKYKFEPVIQQTPLNGLGGVDIDPSTSTSDTPQITFWQIAPNLGD